MIEEVKKALRVTSSAFDSEIQNLIDAAKHELIQTGIVKANDETDPLIKRAITVYCKANFGYDNPDAERFIDSFVMLKQHLSMSADYNGYLVTFNVTDGTNPLENAIVEFEGVTKYTDISGDAKFKGIKESQNLPYIVTLEGYETTKGNVDVSSDETVNVTLAVN